MLAKLFLYSIAGVLVTCQLVCSTVKTSEFNDEKHALPLDFETGNRAQCKIKWLKGSKSGYPGHIAKTISRINIVVSEFDNVEMVIYLQHQLENLVTKLKTVLDTLVELSDSPKDFFVYNELHFEQKRRVVNFKRQISTCIGGNSLEIISETVSFHKACKLPWWTSKTFVKSRKCY